MPTSLLKLITLVYQLNNGANELQSTGIPNADKGDDRAKWLIRQRMTLVIRLVRAIDYFTSRGSDDELR